MPISSLERVRVRLARDPSRRHGLVEWPDSGLAWRVRPAGVEARQRVRAPGERVRARKDLADIWHPIRRRNV